MDYELVSRRLLFLLLLHEEAFCSIIKGVCMYCTCDSALASDCEVRRRSFDPSALFALVLLERERDWK